MKPIFISKFSPLQDCTAPKTTGSSNDTMDLTYAMMIAGIVLGSAIGLVLMIYCIFRCCVWRLERKYDQNDLARHQKSGNELFLIGTYLVSFLSSLMVLQLHVFCKKLGSGHSTKNFLIQREILPITKSFLIQLVSYFLSAELSMWSLTLPQMCFLNFENIT